jgi:hypothetical protein
MSITNAREETIAQRLDRLHGVPLCDICRTPVPRASRSWPICPRCGHNLIGIEGALIQKVRRDRTEVNHA